MTKKSVSKLVSNSECHTSIWLFWWKRRPVWPKLRGFSNLISQRNYHNNYKRIGDIFFLLSIFLSICRVQYKNESWNLLSIRIHFGFIIKSILKLSRDRQVGNIFRIIFFLFSFDYVLLHTQLICANMKS